MIVVCAFPNADALYNSCSHRFYLGTNPDDYGYSRVGWLSHVCQAIPRFPRLDTTKGQDPRLMPGKAGGTCLTEAAHDTRPRPKVAEKLKAHAVPVAN